MDALKIAIPYIFIGLAVIIIGLILICWVRVSDLVRVYRRKYVFIEVTPPLEVLKTPEATEQLFTMLHSIASAQRLRDRLLRRSMAISMEVVSTRKDGVRYIIRAPESEAEVVRRNITAFMPSARIKTINDPLLKADFNLVRDYKQTKHFAFALRTFNSFDQHDPIAYITGLMNRLKDGEQVALQLVIVPIDIRDMKSMVQKYYEYYKVSDMSHNKAYGRLFRVEVRVRISTNSKEATEEQRRGMDAALQSFSIIRVQTLKARYNLARQKYREWSFINRMPALLPNFSNILSSLELANIYHFPGSQTSTENLNRSLSRTLSVPLSIRNNQNFDFVIGETNHHGEKQLIGLTEKEREKHVYLIGGTGNGKTTVLQNAIVNDIKNGKGLAVVDPHGDMAEEILKHIPEERIKDVIYFNPDDIENPIGLNLLEVPEGLSGNELLRERERIAESVVSILRKIFSDNDTGGSRIESMIRNAVYTAFEAENPTLFTIYDLINDDKFRNKVVQKLDNEHLKKFWLNEFGKAGGMQQVKMAAGVTTKIGRFLFSEAARRIMSQQKSTIDFDTLIEDGKILICNFSKGLLGEDTSALFGVVTIAKLQLAALKRARLKKADRRPFYVYVDEFQNFATPSFVQMLAEARKYQMYLIMAEQSTSQQASEMVNIMLANVGTVVTFRTGNPADERTILPLFEPFISRNEIANLSAYNFYARIAAVRSQEPVSGSTIVIEDQGSDVIAERVIESSRALYATKETVGRPAAKKSQSEQPITQNEPRPSVISQDDV